MKHLHLIAFAVLLTTTGAHAAESNAGSTSTSGAVVAPQNIGNPVIQIESAPGHTRADFHTNQAATAATVFVNPPAADTCAMAGTGVSAQVAGFGGAISNGGDASKTCETRADTINMKVIGVTMSVIKARHCQNPVMALAYEDAGEPCVERLRPARPITAGTQPESSASSDPYIARSGRSWPNVNPR
jgi:hypothetical protein